MFYQRIFCYGTLAGMTDSCHGFCAEAGTSFPIDRGLFQRAGSSSSAKSGRDALRIELPLQTIRAMVAARVHTDHFGRIPDLLAGRFQRLCIEPSATLLLIVLEDALNSGVSFRTRGVEQYNALDQRIIAVSYTHRSTMRDTAELVCGVQLRCAGHILRSTYGEPDFAHPTIVGGTRMLFSGDLGAPHAMLLSAGRPLYGADSLVSESTYDGRQCANRLTRRQRLKNVSDQALEDNGTVFISAFSIGHAHESPYQAIVRRPRTTPAESVGRGLGSSTRAFLLDINWRELLMSRRFTVPYRQLQPPWNKELPRSVKLGRRPLGFERLILVNSYSDHTCMVQQMARTARPAIVIAGNGMCSSGRIVNYLKAMLGDSRHNVLFVGHQAAGTPGRAIQIFGPQGGYVDLEGERLNIRAGVSSIGGYSAHADQDGLVRFVTGMRRKPSHIRIVHGEQKAKQALAERLDAFYQGKQQALQLTIPQ